VFFLIILEYKFSVRIADLNLYICSTW